MLQQRKQQQSYYAICIDISFRPGRSEKQTHKFTYKQLHNGKYMYVCMYLCVRVCACVFVCLLLCKNCCNKIHLQIPSPCCVYATYATASYKKKRIHNIARALVWKRVCIRRRIACQLWHVKYFKRSHIHTCMYILICVCVCVWV